MPLYNVFSFSSVSNVSYVFSIFNSILKFSGKKVYFINFSFAWNCTDPDPAKWCGSDPIPIHNTGLFTFIHSYKTPVISPWRTHHLQKKTPPSEWTFCSLKHEPFLFFLSGGQIGFPRTGSKSEPLNFLKPFTCLLVHRFMNQVPQSLIRSFYTWRSSLLIISTSLPSEMERNSSPSEIFVKR